MLLHVMKCIQFSYKLFNDVLTTESLVCYQITQNERCRLIDTDLEGSGHSEFQRTVSAFAENEEKNLLVKLAAISMSNKFPTLLI